jgi:hypothetical protein
VSSSSEPLGLPTTFGRRAAPALIPLLVVPLTALVVLVFDRPPSWFQLGLYVLVAVVIVVRAWSSRHRPALVLDAEGIRHPNGTLLMTWQQAALIWVSDDLPRWVPRSMRALSLRAWEASALDYARRTGFQATVRLHQPWLPTSLEAADVVDLISSRTHADVRSGSSRDLRRLLDQLPNSDAG